ncbi:MAG: translation initiation factor IF-3 [Planctomycetaceae bacterium]|nr:translation initiation factor IF-3 [Planctomycetaceae bacterium]
MSCRQSIDFSLTIIIGESMALRRMDSPRDNKEFGKQRVNESIRISQVRVISAEGAQLGILNTSEALALARQAGLDLVEVASDSKPPVCRIMDYGKFRYQQKKRQTKQHTHQSKLKEVRLRPKTGEHDITVKINKAREFLNNKDKVQITVSFKGRELAHIDEGEKVLKHLIAELDDISKIEAPPKRAEKRIICTLAPK